MEAYYTYHTRISLNTIRQLARVGPGFPNTEKSGQDSSHPQHILISRNEKQRNMHRKDAEEFCLIKDAKP